MKQIINNISITFTVFTVLDLILSLINNKPVSAFDSLFRFALCVIGFSSGIIFSYLKNLPLRLVQLIHFLIIMVSITILLFILNQATMLSHKYIVNTYTSSTIVYFIIAMIYEIYYRRKIKSHNKLLKKVNTK